MASEASTKVQIEGINCDILGPADSRGNPSMKFIESVEDFLDGQKTSADEVLTALNLMHGKYKAMETHVATMRATISKKLPEIEQSLEMILHLQSKKDTDESMMTHFNLSDNVFAKAEVSAEDKAGIMVEYSYEEAIALLTENKNAAVEKLASYKENLDFLRDQIITSEVNIARVFNYDVKQRREAKA